MLKLLFKSLINYRTYVLLVCGMISVLAFVAMPIDDGDFFLLTMSKLVSVAFGLIAYVLYHYYRETHQIDALVELVHKLPDWMFGEEKQ